MSCTRRCVPFRQTSRVRTTTLMVPLGRMLSGSGLNWAASKAFGITNTFVGSSWQRSDTFSLDVCETVTTVSACESTKRQSLLRWMSALSEKPKLECSV